MDDLWALGLAFLSDLRRYDRLAVEKARLTGRDLEPWRSILAVALWLQEEFGVDGLFGRIEALSVDYQQERDDLEPFDPTKLAIQALVEDYPAGGSREWIFETSSMVKTVNRLAREQDLVSREDEDFTNAKRLGVLLSRLRIRKATPGRNKRKRVITRAELENLARSYGLTPLPSHAANADDAETPSASRHDRQVRQEEGTGTE